MKLRDAFFRDLPGERQIFDYGVRTDGQPVYIGHAPIDDDTSDGDWVMQFFKYDGSDQVTETYCLKGVWDDRTTLFLDYA